MFLVLDCFVVDEKKKFSVESNVENLKIMFALILILKHSKTQ